MQSIRKGDKYGQRSSGDQEQKKKINKAQIRTSIIEPWKYFDQNSWISKTSWVNKIMVRWRKIKTKF